MKKEVLNIGDVKTVDYPATMACFGIGSCIALFIEDPLKGIVGGAHIFLPDNEVTNDTDGKCYNASMAIETLLGQLKARGSALQGLRAKVVGGANVLLSNLSIGASNSQSVIDNLIQRRIFIAFREVGGCQARTVFFNTGNGEMSIRTSMDNGFR